MAEVLTIDELRNRIDVIDTQLVTLLSVRVACAVEIGQIKHGTGQAVYQPDRETQVLDSVRQSATDLAGSLEAEAAARIFERIIDEARRAERRASESRGEGHQSAEGPGE